MASAVAATEMCRALPLTAALSVVLQDNLALHAEHFPHTQGSKSAIYQFQIDNNNAKAKQTSAVQFTAEISPGDFSTPVLLRDSTQLLTRFPRVN